MSTILSTLRKSCTKSVCQPVGGLPGSFLLWMDIGVHGGHDVRMAQHRLQGFRVCHCLEYRCKRMSEYMRRSSIQVDGLSNALPCPLVGLCRAGGLSTLDKARLIGQRLQVFCQLVKQRDTAVPCFRLWFPYA